MCLFSCFQQPVFLLHTHLWLMCGLQHEKAEKYSYKTNIPPCSCWAAWAVHRITWQPAWLLLTIRHSPLQLQGSFGVLCCFDTCWLFDGEGLVASKISPVRRWHHWVTQKNVSWNVRAPFLSLSLAWLARSCGQRPSFATCERSLAVSNRSSNAGW